MKQNHISRSNNPLAIMLGIALAFSCSSIMAQGGDIGGGDVGGGVGGGQPNLENIGGANFGASDRFEGITISDLTPQIPPEPEPIPSDRNQGFIGITATDLQENGFIGQSSQALTAPSKPLGGGVNAGVTGGGGRGGGGRGGGFTANAQSGLTRANLRTRVNYGFLPANPRVDAGRASQFNSRINSMPVNRSFGRGINVSIQNRTATLTGFVQSREQARMVQRQLMLEPGVYKINNQLQIGQ